jgi:signal peptidase I
MELLLLVLVVVLFVRVYVLGFYRISSGEMAPTLVPGDCLVVSKLGCGIRLPLAPARIPGLKPPRRDEVVVFQFVGDPSKDFVMRVAALPCEIVELRDKTVLVDAEPYRNGHERYADELVIPFSQYPRDNSPPQQVAASSYFVMGDNRDSAYDSRFWGAVPAHLLRGRGLFIYWSSHPDSGIAWRRIGTILR